MLSNEERDAAQETREKIARIKEKLITKNVAYRALKSQVDDPNRICEIIAKREEEIALLQCSILHLEGILESGLFTLCKMLGEIHNLEDQLRLLENAKNIEKLEKVFQALVESGQIPRGLSIESLMAQIESGEGSDDE